MKSQLPVSTLEMAAVVSVPELTSPVLFLTHLGFLAKHPGLIVLTSLLRSFHNDHQPITLLSPTTCREPRCALKKHHLSYPY